MKKSIGIHQRVLLAGSKLRGTTISVTELRVAGKTERTFQVQWDATGSFGTVSETDLEPLVERNNKAA